MYEALSALALLAVMFGLLWHFAKGARQDGAAVERLKQAEAILDEIRKARIARDVVRDGGGVPIHEDPNNRDNRL